MFLDSLCESLCMTLFVRGIFPFLLYSSMFFLFTVMCGAAAVAGMSVFGHATAVHERIEPLTSAVCTDAHLKQTL